MANLFWYIKFHKKLYQNLESSSGGHFIHLTIFFLHPTGDGVVRVYYDPLKSVNGAKLCVFRQKSKQKQTSYMATPHIITPYSLPMFKEDR